MYYGKVQERNRERRIVGETEQGPEVEERKGQNLAHK